MKEAEVRKGSRVKFRLGMRFVEGVVREDIGGIGVKGRHLYRVRFLPGLYDEPYSEIELPAVDLYDANDPITIESLTALDHVR